LPARSVLKSRGLRVWIGIAERKRSEYGVSKEKTESENFKTQTPQAYAGESPQETLAI
jgi:hypothetical protein